MYQGKRANKLGGSHLTGEDPILMQAKRYIQPIPKGREGKNFNKLQTASWFIIEDKLPGEPWTADWGFYSNAFQTIFSFFQFLFFHRKRHFYPFFAAFHFLRTDFIDSGGVKKTNTEKYTFLRCDFYGPQKSMTWVIKNHVNLLKKKKVILNPGVRNSDPWFF